MKWKYTQQAFVSILSWFFLISRYDLYMMTAKLRERRRPLFSSSPTSKDVGGISPFCSYEEVHNGLVRMLSTSLQPPACRVCSRLRLLTLHIYLYNGCKTKCLLKCKSVLAICTRLKLASEGLCSHQNYFP